MATLKSKDNLDMIIECKCGCDEGIRFRIDKDDDYYAVMTYLSGHFYKEQKGVFSRLAVKLKRIFAIILNQDYYYSEVIMDKNDFDEFKKFINMY